MYTRKPQIRVHYVALRRNIANEVTGIINTDGTTGHI